jgi:hypothetical protein
MSRPRRTAIPTTCARGPRRGPRRRNVRKCAPGRPSSSTQEHFRSHGVGPCQGGWGIRPPWRAGGLGGGWLLVSAVDAGPQPGQAGAPRWTNDLAAGEDRRRIGWREGPDDLPELAHTYPFGPEVGPHDDGIGPGCSVRSTAVLPAQAEARARPVWPSPVVVAVWTSLRMWKQRASSRRAIATVAIWVPRRRASWP